MVAAQEAYLRNHGFLFLYEFHRKSSPAQHAALVCAGSIVPVDDLAHGTGAYV
jgi:hypothetical protein